jgi:hypothetical protein
LGLGALAIVASKKARPFNATVSRVGGTGFYSDATSVRNIYTLRFINKRNQTATVTMRLGADSPPGFQLSGTEESFTVNSLQEMTRTIVVIAPMDAYTGVTDVVLEVHADPGDVTLEKKVRFLGPNPQSIQSNPESNETTE